MNGKIAIIVGLIWMFLISLTSCDDKIKTNRVRFSITQDSIFRDGDVIITTKISECEDYDKTSFVYVYTLIYTNEVVTTIDSISLHKHNEMEKVDAYIHMLIDEK